MQCFECNKLRVAAQRIHQDLVGKSNRVAELEYELLTRDSLIVNLRIELERKEIKIQTYKDNFKGYAKPMQMRARLKKILKAWNTISEGSNGRFNESSI